MDLRNAISKGFLDGTDDNGRSRISGFSRCCEPDFRDYGVYQIGEG